MNKAFKVPPLRKGLLTPPEKLADRLQSLIGAPFKLTRKTRTDGANMRKVIAAALEQHPLPPPCPPKDYEIIPPRGKGVPRILREYIDTYIVTTGTSYNLQVWNRNPAEESIQVEYQEGESLSAKDVRFVFARVDPDEHIIRSVIILSPEYIVQNFGEFGKPTIKHQLIITPKTREIILQSDPPIIFHPDHPQLQDLTTERNDFSGHSIHEEPTAGQILSLERIRDIVIEEIVGKEINGLSTKTRGQHLEAHIASVLGYEHAESDVLVGDYPDIRHQVLEVKVQDSPTVDLGKYSPQFEETVPSSLEFTTEAVRYLITLTNSSTGVVEGAVICPGSRLGEHFSYVADKSYKCQRSIPMSFFDRYAGQAVANP